MAARPCHLASAPGGVCPACSYRVNTHRGRDGGDIREGRDWPIKEVCDVSELHSSTIPRCSWNHPVSLVRRTRNDWVTEGSASGAVRSLRESASILTCPASRDSELIRSLDTKASGTSEFRNRQPLPTRCLNIRVCLITNSSSDASTFRCRADGLAVGKTFEGTGRSTSGALH